MISAARVTLLGVLLATFPLAAQQPPAAPFRAGVDIVSLTVTVTTPDNRYVTDLSKDDFMVFEDGVKQEITFFTRTQVPVALALLVDTSASMEEKLGTAQQAAIGFARRLRSEDMAEVIEFDSRVDIIQKFTNDQAMLEKAIRSTSAGGSTSLNNAIYISLKELKKIKAQNADEIRRQAIVVLSDGEDTSSLVPFEEVLELAKRSETSIYTIGYSSKNIRRDGAWRRVVVRVQRPNATPRTKQGYYAPVTTASSQ